MCFLFFFFFFFFVIMLHSDSDIHSSLLTMTRSTIIRTEKCWEEPYSVLVVNFNTSLLKYNDYNKRLFAQSVERLHIRFNFTNLIIYQPFTVSLVKWIITLHGTPFVSMPVIQQLEVYILSRVSAHSDLGGWHSWDNVTVFRWKNASLCGKYVDS